LRPVGARLGLAGELLIAQRRQPSRVHERFILEDKVIGRERDKHHAQQQHGD
jgi:hypothetical protein